AAWERNGSLDAISRAFSYIFARPLQFFWNYFLIVLFAVVILIAGGHFVKILTGSIDAALWHEPTSVLIDPPQDAEKIGKLTDDTKKMMMELHGEDGVTADPPALD